MSSTHEGSSAASGSSKKTPASRRSWTLAEEQALVAAVKNLIATGQKTKNGFRPGYLRLLEDAMTTAFLNTDLTGNPNITSKLSAWKKNYSSLLTILNRSGVGFNTHGNHMIDCEDEQWEQIVKADPNARLMRYKSWPLFEDWREMFGVDRANGENAADVLEACNELEKEDQSQEYVDLSFDNEVSFENELNEAAFDKASESTKNEKPSKKGGRSKKAKVNNELQGICDLLGEMNETTNARLEKLANRFGFDVDISQARQAVFDQIGEIPGISLADRFKVCELVCFNDKRMDMWRGMKPAARAQYVEHLLNSPH